VLCAVIGLIYRVSISDDPTEAGFVEFRQHSVGSN
jgi:hypothetical protein